MQAHVKNSIEIATGRDPISVEVYFTDIFPFLRKPYSTSSLYFQYKWEFDIGSTKM